MSISLLCKTQWLTHSHVNCFHLEINYILFSNYKNCKKNESLICLLENLGMKVILRSLAPGINFINVIHSSILIEQLWASGQLGNISEQNRLIYLLLCSSLLVERKRYTISDKRGILDCVSRQSWGRIPSSVYLSSHIYYK